MASTSASRFRNTFPTFDELRSPIPFKIAINRSERSLRELYNKPPSFEHAIRGMGYEIAFMSAMLYNFDCYNEYDLSENIREIDNNLRTTYASLQALMSTMYSKVDAIGNVVCNNHNIPVIDNLQVNATIGRRNLGYRDRRYWPRNPIQTVNQLSDDSDVEITEIVPADPELRKSLLIKKESPILYAYHSGQLHRKFKSDRATLTNIDLNEHDIDFDGKNLSDIIESESECMICSEVLSNANFLFSNACCHCFCTHCMDKMFENKFAINCPHCRTVMHKKSMMSVHKNDQSEYVFQPTYM